MTLLELFQLLKKHMKLVVALPIICAVMMAGVSVFVMTNTYTAQTSMYILASSTDPVDASSNYSNLNASQMLANDVATLLKSDIVLDKAAESLSLKNLSGYQIDVTNESTSRVITLTVTGHDPKAAASVANAIAASVSDVARDVKMAESVNVIDQAATPNAPSGPNRTLYVAVAFMAGLFMAVAIVVLLDMLNTRIRGVDEIEELLGIPVIGRVPMLKKGGK